MVRVLIVTDSKPESIRNGSWLRVYNLCRSLSRTGNTVLLAYLQDPCRDSMREFPGICAEQEIEIGYPDQLSKTDGKIFKTAISLFPGLATHLQLKEQDDFGKRVAQIVKINRVDVVHVHGHIPGLMLMHLRGIPSILDLTDSMCLYLRRQAFAERASKKGIAYRLFYYWWRGIEETLVSQYEYVTVVSPADAEMLASLSDHAKIRVVPNGVDADYFSPIQESSDSLEIVFHGAMDFNPNIVSVEYIINRVMPAVWSIAPEAVFVVAGRYPPSRIKNLHDGRRIVVTGEVPDIRYPISKAAVVLVPMIAGSGIKNKILEAMAMGKAVVTNELGAEALSPEARNGILVGGNERELADHVVRLLKDGQLRSEIGTICRSIVLNQYSWNQVAREYETLYGEVISSRRSILPAR